MKQNRKGYMKLARSVSIVMLKHTYLVFYMLGKSRKKRICILTQVHANKNTWVNAAAVQQSSYQQHLYLPTAIYHKNMTEMKI